MARIILVLATLSAAEEKGIPMYSSWMISAFFRTPQQRWPAQHAAITHAAIDLAAAQPPE